MLIERSTDANLIVYVDVIVNQAEYQNTNAKFEKVKEQEQRGLKNLSMRVFSYVSPCHPHHTAMLTLKNY